MVHISPVINDSVVDGMIRIYVTTPYENHFVAEEVYTRIFYYVNHPIFNDSDLYLHMNSDTLDKVRGIVGGSFGYIKMVLPVPKGILP